MITEVLIFTIKTSKRHVNYAQLTTIINCDNKSQTNHALINTYKKVIKVITNSSKSKSKRSAKVTQGHQGHLHSRTVTGTHERSRTPTHERSRRLTQNLKIPNDHADSRTVPNGHADSRKSCQNSPLDGVSSYLFSPLDGVSSC